MLSSESEFSGLLRFEKVKVTGFWKGCLLFGSALCIGITMTMSPVPAASAVLAPWIVA